MKKNMKVFIISKSLVNFLNEEDYSLIDACVCTAYMGDESIIYEFIDYMTDDCYDNEEEYNNEINRLSDLSINLLQEFVPYLKQLFKNKITNDHVLESVEYSKNNLFLKFDYYE